MSTPLRYNIGIFLFLFFCGNLIAQNQIPFSKPNLPFSFIENKGQIKATSDSSGSDILFYGRDKSVEIYFKSHAVNFQFTEYHIIENDRNFNKEKTPGNQGKIIKKTLHGMGFTLLGSNPQVQISGLKKKESVLNFYLGHTPENGILNVAQFEELWYHNIYDHIDLKFSIQSQGIKYEFVIYPGGNPDQIQMKWEGTTPEIRPEGGIKYANPSGELLESAPVTFTNSGISVESSFHIENTNVVGFKVHKGFQNDTVIIDPVIQWGTFVGGSQFDIVLGMQVDSTGNVYISGQTGSTSGIATTGSFRSSNNGYTDGFISKFNSKGNMIWSTYYGGALNDGLGQMAMGKSNQLYVCGWTESDTGIATSGAWQPNRSGYYDLIFAKFNGNGNRIWASYFGGTDEEDFPSIMLGNNQKIYVSGATASDSLATAGAYQDYNSSPWDLIIACFNDSGTQQYTATYYGGNSNDYWGILFQHPSGKIGIIATTESDAGIATSNAYQDFLWGTSDMAVALFKSDLSDIYWSTYFGGNEDEVGLNAFCDKAGNIYFSGGSSSDTGITDTLSFKPALSGFSDGFYAKFRDTGSRVYSTYFGGNNEDDLLISGFNDSGRLNICGSTTSDSGISMGVSCSQTNYRNGVDCYFGEMDTTGKSLWASYFGGDDNEYPTNLIVKKDSIYLSGHTYSDTGIATSGAFHTSRGGLLEGFVAKFVRCSLREYFIDTSACNSFTLNGKTYYTTGEYAQHLIAKNKCDSCIHLRLTIRDSSSSSVNITACDSLNYYGSVYKVSGIYNRTTTNKAGCDSVVKLYLTIAQKSDTSISVSGCDSLKFRGISYYSSGNYVQQTTNNAGCDSTINLQVTLNSTKYSTVNSSVCDSMVWYGNTYKTSGNYQKKLTSYKGCDSVVTLNLTVKKSTINSITASSCDSAIYFGTTYKTSGTYTKKYSNSAGCDSVVTLNLTIKKSTDTTINLTGCDSITFRSTKYFSSGNYAQKTTNKAGCDSTINLKITLNSTKYSAINST
ncbi:MAG: hypothetical protein KG003_02920, partial [Bacteroidetes bacterium]|nr:hypothetical protein [Bacteroidota bacterium]